ncbi:flagellar hook-basal body protein [Ruminiclostridium cellobioparum]|uniref:Flagellar hook-basal body protein n=1 Tax=Ruminiclostridium cellobioparum subsp. termitidis CT1112 TaxID=1195236 RepID=S0FGL5_RUMCE|nr:flagellar hook-basal body protein [Ruminiclostridium cellobioparum]EMS70247.1 flagellar hook-basal body protein [Ruminiclostridium cellobioparum subsp. termitidis CT1112]
MIRGLYTSAWSMLANDRKMDVITNNLANVNTAGYKKDTVVFESFPDLLTKRINDTKNSSNIGSMELSSDVGEIFTYFTQGQLNQTNNMLDLAIDDNGGANTSSPAFFTVGVVDPSDNSNLKEYYTKDGSFVLNSDNQLVTKDGNYVLGQSGPITLEPGQFSIDDMGNIVQDGAVVDTLRITQFSDPAMLRKFGDNMLENTGSETSDFTGSVLQGFSEGSNVNVISEMVDMITVMRAYEANQKVLQSHDSLLEKAVNEVGVVR